MKENKGLINAETNRYICSNCSGKINKGEKLFRDAMSNFRNSHTVNICQRCLVKFFIKLNISDEELSDMRKEIIFEKLSN